ncbi:MAG: hypothetical protein V1872_02905 [bacterium]
MEIHPKIKKYWKLIVIWVILFIFITASIIGHFDKKVSTAIVILYGLATQIFSIVFPYILSAIGAVPFLGPILTRILLWPINTLASLLAVTIGLVKVKQGNVKEVVGARLITLLFALGVLIGYLIGKII